MRKQVLTADPARETQYIMLAEQDLEASDRTCWENYFIHLI